MGSGMEAVHEALWQGGIYPSDVLGLQGFGLKQVKYSFVLIIKKHDLSWLPPVSDALKSSMRHVLKLWNIPDVYLKVMNEKMALDAGYCAK